MALFEPDIKSYLIQTRPQLDNTVDIVAVLTFRLGTNPILAMCAMDEACASMLVQMQQDLLSQAAEMGIDVIYWRFVAECHFDKN
jgi:hypothetical protein